MNRRVILNLSMVTALGFIILPGMAWAQQKTLKEQVIGTWAYSSDENVAADGTKRQLFGPGSRGLLVLSANGQYSQIISRADVPRFKSNNRLEGTPEENRAAVQGTTAAFGTWSINETDHTLVVRIEGGLFPNQSGSDSIRTVSVFGDELRYVSKVGGGGTSTTIFVRAK